ncbi:MAG: methyl-accepting chemotaxis protein [Breznakibacter sp.]
MKILLSKFRLLPPETKQAITFQSVVATSCVIVLILVKDSPFFYLWAFLVLVAVIALQIVLLLNSHTGILRKMAHAQHIVSEISAGNFAVGGVTKSKSRNKDPFSNAIENMVKLLNRSMKQISRLAQSVDETSLNFEDNARQVAETASITASNVEEMSAAIEQMTSNINQSTGNAVKAQTLANEATVWAKKGNESSQKAREAMGMVAEKIGFVQHVASQTNILAINAAIEASRTGEGGKGFAVIASEVRKLAEMTKYNAIEIERITREAMQMAEQAGIDMERLLPQVMENARLVNEIYVASSEQRTGAEQISEAVNILNTVSQQNADLADTMKQDSSQLTARISLLSDLTRDFKTI